MNSERRPFYARVLGAAAVVVALVALITGLLVAIDVLFLAFAGVLLAVLIRALSGLLCRHTPLSEKAAVWTVVGVGVVALGLVGAFVGARLVDEVGQFGEAIPATPEKLKELIDRYAVSRETLGRVPRLPEQVIGGVQELAKSAEVWLAPFQAVGYLVFIFFVAIYLAINPALYTEGLARFFPQERRSRVREVLAHLGEVLRRWLVARVAAMSTVGALTTVLLVLLDVPLALVLGLIAGLLSFVPYLGTLTSGVVIVVITLVQSPDKVVYVVAAYTGIELFEGYVLTPVFQKIAVHLPPAVTLIAQIAMGVFFGVIGVVFATPLAAVLLGLFHTVYLEDILGEPQAGEGKSS